MSVHHDTATKTWYVMCYYDNWEGTRKQKCKRGFERKKDAQAWEREFLMQSQGNIEMTFESFYQLYERDIKPTLKLNTWLNKESIIKKLILPYFKDRIISEITSRDILIWQNTIRSLPTSRGTLYSADTLKHIHSQLSSIFNHAVRHYGLKTNPTVNAGRMGSEDTKEMKFWTKDEYLQFATETMDKPLLYYAFEMLYWCGLRVGELLALTPSDFNFTAKTVSIYKSYQRIHGKDIITTPKTRKSKRVVAMPDFLCNEIQEYIHMYYSINEKDRLFRVSKHQLGNEIKRVCKKTGLQLIRLHDLRHSHVSLLIDMKFTALAIADRMGHEAIDITYRYAHLFPTAQTQMAERLNEERGVFHE